MTRRMTSVAWLPALLTGLVGCAQPASAPPKKKAPSPRPVVTVSVDTKTIERTSVQPAIVHAFHEARVFAKASGYVAELNVDIGSKVQAGDVLAVLDVPEMVARLEREKATLKRLNAAVAGAEAEIVVAKASLLAVQSRQAQAQADEQRAAADLKADTSEHTRVGDLVKQQAVADRLLDEATKRLDASRAAKSAAEATTAAAAAEVDVAKAKMVAAEAELAAARADVQVGQKRLEELQTLMSYAELRAPFAGIVTERYVEPGDLVRNSQNNESQNPLLVVSQLDKVRVRVAIPERDAPLANAGDPATLTFQALPGETFEGTIARTSGGLDQGTQTMRVEIDLPNPDGKLIPGLFGQATIRLDARANQVTLPASAVRYDERGRSYVYVIDEDETVRVVDVATGMDDGNQIEITSGLDGSERVVGPLLHRLATGQKVHVEG